MAPLPIRNLSLFFLVLCGLGVVECFLPSQNSFVSRRTAMNVVASGSNSNDDDSRFFTGGAFDKMEPEAIKIASRINSVKDLGWTGPAMRRGTTYPRHRAFGGQSEKPVQDKPNYDTSNPRCVEKWLSQEEFYAKVRDSSPAADTVFVALAGGGAFAEREVVEEKLSAWRSGGKFDEDAFLKTVKDGRFGLAAGWLLFSTVVGSAALCIVAPTNPLAKALESALAPLSVDPDFLASVKK